MENRQKISLFDLRQKTLDININLMSFITIKSSHNVSDLIVLKSRLESEGIPCFIKNENTTAIMSHMATFVAELQVDEKDLERVREILEG